MAETVRVEEAYTERDETINAQGAVTEIEIPYLVFDVADESAALAAAKPKVKSVRGMALESIETVERINGTTWKVKAVYAADDGGGESDTDAGEVLFLGASGTKRSRKATAPWEITYRFAVSPNKAGFRVGDIQVNRKRGWDYLWVRYADKVAEGGRNVVKKPVAAYVEQVYPEGDFGNLGLGN